MDLKPPRRWIIAACLACHAAAMAMAAPIEWKKQPFVYVATDKALADVLRDFARHQGFAAVVDRRVEGAVSVHFWNPPGEVASILRSSYGISTFAEGRTLHFFRSADIVTRVMKVRSLQPERLRASLRRLGLDDARFPIGFDEAEKAVVIQGPESIVTTISEAVQALDEGRSDPASTEEVRIFPLRFAWAQDKRVTNEGTTTTLPGVATVLKRLFQGQAEPAAEAGARRPRSPSPPAGKTVRSAVMGDIEVPPTFEQATRAYREAPADAGRRTALPQIEADGQMNAVIVRDHAYRMDWYTRLIATLDVKPARIEIEAHIIDVEATSMDRIGIRWQARGPRSTATFDASPGTPTDSLLGGTLTTIIGGSRHKLLTTLNALEQSGKARVVAQPKVLTLNNVEANLSNTETFHVRVAGNLSAELFNVSTGTRLRVTPLVSQDGDGRRLVKLAIDAQDGDFSSVSVDQIPVVKSRDIATHALIHEGESLLIGGMVYERETSATVGVPVLSRVPLLGWLFKDTERSRQRVERLFLITPRIIDEDAAANQARQAPLPAAQQVAP